jgi:hypothetical protein
VIDARFFKRKGYIHEWEAAGHVAARVCCPTSSPSSERGSERRTTITNEDYCCGFAPLLIGYSITGTYRRKGMVVVVTEGQRRA